jgi:hypothetical protein
MDINYTAEPTIARFHMDKSFVRGIIGPIGSGKSVGCSWEIMLKSLAQEPHNKVRQTRWVVVRNTYRELQDTTMRTFFDWFPHAEATLHKMDMKCRLNQKLPDGSILDSEILFRALDKPDDVKKLLSLELTGGWLNEAREIPKSILDMLIGRLGRYPSQRAGGPSWYGLIMDTNPPDEDHWWYKIFEEEHPEDYKLFRQPSGLAPNAENIKNLPDGYYKRMIAGKDQQWIDVYVHGKYGFVKDGKPIYEEYNDAIHFAENGFLIPKNADIYVGIDFGLTPAATFGYRNEFGQILVFDELVTFSMGSVNFGKLLGQKIRSEWRDSQVIFTGDPAGEQRSDTDESTPFEMLQKQGINAVPAHTNDFSIRREAVANKLTQLAFNGKPALLIGPRCKYLRKGMSGAYKYRRLQVAGMERFMEKPDKNAYSHVCESLQYMMLGLGEDYSVIGSMGNNFSKPLDYTESDRGVI